MSARSGVSDKKAAVFLTLRQIPSGRVVSYGQLARLAGSPGAARWVGSILRQLPADSTLPWHRVVNSRGEIALPPASPAHLEQIRRLTREGVELNRGKIALRRFFWTR